MISTLTLRTALLLCIELLRHLHVWSRTCTSDYNCLLQDAVEEELLQALNAVMVAFLGLREKLATVAEASSTHIQVCT